MYGIKRKYDESKHKELISAFIHFIFLCNVTYFFRNLGNPSHKYNKFYQLLGLQYYIGSVAIKDTLYNMATLYSIYLSKNKYDYKIEHINDEISKIDNNFYIQEIQKYLNIYKEYSIIIKHNKEYESIYNVKMESIVSIINFYILLSSKNKDISINLKDKIGQLDIFVNNYGSSKHILKNCVLMPLLQRLKTFESVNISPIFLSGNPGTGKTKFVKDLSNILEIENYNMILQEYNWIDTSKGFEKQNLSSYTKLIYNSKLKYGHNYGIIFIDEIDKQLKKDDDKSINTELLLNLLSSMNNDREVYDKYLHTNIKIDNVLIICASNTTLDDLCKIHQSFGPLKDRFVEIKIPDISDDLKFKILNDYLLDKLSETTLIHTEFINKLISSIKDKGVRKLLNVLNIYINKLNSAKVFIDTQWSIDNIEKIQEDIINENIENNDNITSSIQIIK